MPRYIDIEPEIQELQSVLNERKDDVNSTVHYTFRIVLKKLKSIPTADVAPRAEVAKEIFREIREKGGFSDPCVLHIVLSFEELDEIEKKYTGGE